MYALIDCNNFFVSCEQVFNPRLKGRPVVVLSNNDGCVISRSKEAKALGIPMGAPAFQCRETFVRHDVAVLSSNFELYGDLSQRVMETLETFGYPMEVYSIDEAFVEVKGNVAPAMREKVRKWTGIPVSIGIGTTKTQAKAAGELAKKDLSGVWELKPQDLEKFPVEDVWGIGRKTAEFLQGCGIRFVGQLCQQTESWIQKHLSVQGLRIVMELKGTSCLDFEEAPAPRKGMVTSRSFSRDIKTLSEMEEAVSHFTSRNAEKLRSEGSQTSFVSVFLMPRHSPTVEAYMRLSVATQDTPTLIGVTKRLVKELFQPGIAYRKAGVMFQGISVAGMDQLDLFAKKGKSIMPIIDALNRRQGKRAVFFAAEGVKQPWKTACSKRSPRYTTNWEELLLVSL
ncbi:MAG: Y-family DNA polymerase [Verrucomicrobia bacterium]|nr:Y-family DNA polymerase [Verrucomicrobiota bacterium]